MNQVRKKKLSHKVVIEKIALRLIGIGYNDLTTAERQITDILIEQGILRTNDNEPWKPVELAS